MSSVVGSEDDKCPDVSTHPLFLELGGKPKYRSLLVAPLLMGEKRIGTISVDSEKANAFDSGDERLLSTLATEAAIAIENARLYGEAKCKAG